MAQVSYARVSSVGQSLDVQMEKLAGCDKVYQEKASASGKRPQLDACLDYIRGGDTLVGTRLDRLARSTLDLCRIAELRQRRQDGVLIKTLMRGLWFIQNQCVSISRFGQRRRVAGVLTV